MVSMGLFFVMPKLVENSEPPLPPSSFLPFLCPPWVRDPPPGLTGTLTIVPPLSFPVDPEMRAEFEAQQKSNPMSSLMGGGGGGGPAAPNPMGSFDMASFLAGSKKEGGGSPAAEGANPGGNGGKKGRK